MKCPELQKLAGNLLDPDFGTQITNICNEEMHSDNPLCKRGKCKLREEDLLRKIELLNEIWYLVSSEL